MDLHKILKPFTINETWYKIEGYTTLIRTLLDYSNAHSWFHYYGTLVPDSDPKYIHYVVLYWTEGQRPTINTFNFKRDYIVDCAWS